MQSSITAVSLTGLALLLAACGSSSSSPEQGGFGDSGTSQDANVSTNEGGGTSPGDDGGAAQDSGGGGTPGVMPAHPPFPTIVNQGVPVLATPKIVMITFNNDANAAAIASFGSSFMTTPYWTGTMKEYGVNAGTSQAVAVTATLAATYTDDPNQPPPSTTPGTIPNLVATTIAKAANNIPAPTADTLYVFYLPATSSVSMQGGTSCKNFGGYHFSTTAAASGTTPIVYAIIPECSPAALGRTAMTQTQFLTFAASHEISEAVTDPQASAAGSGFYMDYQNDISNDLAWVLTGNGEVADLCVDQILNSQDTTTAGTDTVQRVWSVAAAKKGTNPCVPVPTGEIYFNVAPSEPDDLIVVNPGTPATVNLEAFADGTLPGGGTWTLAAFDVTALKGGTAALSFTIPGSTTLSLGSGLSGPAIPVSSGKKVSLGVTLTTAGASTLSAAGNPAAAGWLVSLYFPPGSQKPTMGRYWPIAVTTPAIAPTLGVDASVHSFPGVLPYVQSQMHHGNPFRALFD